MKRRQFLTLLGGAAAAWPLAARAQQRPAVPVVGFLGAGTPSASSPWVNAFVQRLRELGWIEGRSVTMDYRYAEGRNERYAEIAAAFARAKVDVIVTHGTPSAVAAKRATSTIPIVFATAGDPVAIGLVASLARPGGNVTGSSLQQIETSAKRLELLREIVPNLQHLALMANPTSETAPLEIDEIQAAAKLLGVQTSTFEVRRVVDIAPAIDALKDGAQALYVVSEPLLTANRARIATLAVGARLPTMSSFGEFVEAGFLISYGPNFPDLFRRAAEFVDKILRGTKPADIPVEQPIKFDLVVNLITAKAINLRIPETFLVRASEVIE